VKAATNEPHVMYTDAGVGAGNYPKLRLKK